MKRILLATLLCIATLAQAAAPDALDTTHNPKAAAMLHAQYKNPIWLYGVSNKMEAENPCKPYPIRL